MADEASDLNRIIETILWGKTIVEVNNGDGIPQLFILRSLSIKEANLANFIYNKELDKSREAGLLLQKDLEELFRAQNMWSNEDDKKIIDLQSVVKSLVKQIKSAEFMPHRKKQLEKQFAKIEAEINELLHRKNDLFTNSAEARAEEIKRRFIVMMSTETKNETPYWPTEGDFLEESDHVLIYNLAVSYYKHNIFDEKTIRKIARSGIWRYRWKMAKTGADLFGKPICDWSDMQNILVYWSQYYDYVYESYESPPDHIIECDIFCDSWVEEQSKKHAKKGDEKSNIVGTKKSKTNTAHQEQFIMVEPGNKEAIQAVQEMNAPSVRRKLQIEYNKIKNSKKRISEWGLRKGQLPNGERVVTTKNKER